MVWIKNIILILAAIFSLLCFAQATTRAVTQNTIKRIEESAFDAMLKANDNQMLIVFVAAWCGPCIEELPVMNELYAKYKKQGLQLVGISIDLEGPSAMQPFLDRLKIRFPVYWYGERAVEKFKIDAIPMVFFVKDAEIVQRLSGSRTKKNLEKEIKEFLKPKK